MALNLAALDRLRNTLFTHDHTQAIEPQGIRFSKKEQVGRVNSSLVLSEHCVELIRMRETVFQRKALVLLWMCFHGTGLEGKLVLPKILVLG